MDLELLDISIPPVFVATGQPIKPDLVDYDSLGLKKEPTFLKGRLIAMRYYQEYDRATKIFSNLAVLEENEYLDNPEGYLELRLRRVTWYLSDGQVGYSKETEKPFTRAEAMKEGVVRRNNIVDYAKADIIAFLGEMQGADLWISLEGPIRYYIQGIVQPLYDAITASAKPYLNNLTPDGTQTIRTHLLNFVTI